MKTFSKTLLATALLGSAVLSTAATAAQKIGAVDVQSIFQSMPQAATIQQSITAEFKDQTATLEQLKQDLQFQMQKLQRESATMSAAEVKKLEGKILAMRKEYADKGQPLQQAIQTRLGEERNKLLSLIKQALDSVAAKEKYDLVLNANAIAFTNKKHDLTEKVLNKVKKIK